MREIRDASKGRANEGIQIPGRALVGVRREAVYVIVDSRVA